MKIYDPGQKLRDERYGVGVVLEADPEYTTIRFRSHGIKKYITSLLRMEPIKEPEPGEAKASAKKSAARKAGKARRAARPAASKAKPKPAPRRAPSRAKKSAARSPRRTRKKPRR